MSSQLDQDEQALLDAYDRGEFRSVMDPARKRFLEQAATAALGQKTEVSVMIPEQDVVALRMKAREAGISYETLVASVLHNFAAGRLYELSANQRIACEHHSH